MQRGLLAVILCLTSLASACASPNSTDGARLSANKPPAISGAPIQSVVVGESYSFTPKATDPEGKALRFSIQGKPSWAAFDSRTGRLSGNPTTVQVGVYSNIRISASDGKVTSVLPAFRIAVNATGDGSVTLSWMPPTSNEDGSILKDLEGYRIYYGRSASALDRLIVINNGGLTRYVVEGLASSTWFFAMSAVNKRGVESERSSTVRKKVA